MRKFSCLYFLLLASVVASAKNPETLLRGFNNSYRTGNVKPLFCAINYSNSNVSKISNPVSQFSGNAQNLESGISSVVKIYPNPAKKMVTVYFPVNSYPERSTVSLLNLTGQEVKNVILHSSSTTINLTGLMPGLYIYRICNQNQVIKSGKLIIE